jgi:hypothetical protein
MKLQALFENPHEENILDWFVKCALYKKALYGGENQSYFDSRKKEFEESGLSPYEFFEKSDNITFLKDEVDSIRDVKISGNKVSMTSFAIRDLDEVGPPPFVFEEIERAFVVMGSKKLTKTEPWFPKKSGFIRISSCPNFSLSGIDKRVKTCSELGIVGDGVKGGVLGLLNIKELNFVRLDLPDQPAGRGELLSDIIMEHLPAAKDYNGGDIMGCQSELIDNGFEEFAKL